MIERYGYVPDSGGAGKFRGGLALVRQYRFLAEEGVLQLRTDRRTYVPYGLQGGRSGTASMNLSWRDGEMRELPSKCRLTIQQGDVFRHVLGGAGGWGDPAQRDAARIADDVAEGKLSMEHARREYWKAIHFPTEGLRVLRDSERAG
jgi:N-methylhydantoinase B